MIKKVHNPKKFKRNSLFFGRAYRAHALMPHKLVPVRNKMGAVGMELFSCSRHRVKLKFNY